MKTKQNWGILLAGLCAGIVNGMFGAGGGMVLVPLLTLLTDISDDLIFPTSVCIILPICIVSLLCSSGSPVAFTDIFPYLLGSSVGGILCGLLGKKIPTLWLHRILGIFILWGGIRYLC